MRQRQVLYHCMLAVLAVSTVAVAYQIFLIMLVFSVATFMAMEHLEKRRRLIENATIEHAALMHGDELMGIHGRFTPAELS